MDSHQKILTPDDPGFYDFVPLITPDFHQRRKDEGNMVMVQREGSLIMEALPEYMLDEYLFGGEYDAVMQGESGFDIEYD